MPRISLPNTYLTEEDMFKSINAFKAYEYILFLLLLGLQWYLSGILIVLLRQEPFLRKELISGYLNILIATILPFFLAYINTLEIWHPKRPIKKNLHQRIIRYCYALIMCLQLASVALNIDISLNEGWLSLAKSSAWILFIGGGTSLPLSVYCLQFFWPTVRKRFWFGVLLLPFLFLWYWGLLVLGGLW
ncbi:MAG: hypothetical protein ACRCVN_06135 [Spirochaetia bacterium]